MFQARNAFQLPQHLAVFPLTGTVLMPYGHLPLNIFEPRYIQMIDDALGAERIIGMIQPRVAEANLIADDAVLYDVGTAGRIVHFQDTGDGRYLITLEGLSRFHVKADLADTSAGQAARGYRWVEVDYSPYKHDMNAVATADEPGRERLLELMGTYFGHNDIDADWGAVSAAPYEALVSSLSMSCPFAPPEKQALLECATFQDRARMLICLFEMSGDARSDLGSARH